MFAMLRKYQTLLGVLILVAAWFVYTVEEIKDEVYQTTASAYAAQDEKLREEHWKHKQSEKWQKIGWFVDDYRELFHLQARVKRFEWVWGQVHPYDPMVDHDGDCFCSLNCRGSLNPTCEAVLPGDWDDRPGQVPQRLTGEDVRPFQLICAHGAGIYNAGIGATSWWCDQGGWPLYIISEGYGRLIHPRTENHNPYYTMGD